jgi:hypothetical protein
MGENIMCRHMPPNYIQCEENISMNIPNDASYQSSLVPAGIDKQGYCRHVVNHWLQKPFWYILINILFHQCLWQLRHYILFYFMSFVRMRFVSIGLEPAMFTLQANSPTTVLLTVNDKLVNVMQFLQYWLQCKCLWRLASVHSVWCAA